MAYRYLQLLEFLCGNNFAFLILSYNTTDPSGLFHETKSFEYKIPSRVWASLHNQKSIIKFHDFFISILPNVFAHHDQKTYRMTVVNSYK